MKVSIRQTNMILFALYNMVYVLYRVHMLNRMVYMATLGVFFLFEVYVVLSNKNPQGMYIRKEFRETMLVAFVFLFISLGIQTINGNFQTYLYEELLYFVVPCLAGYVCVNYSSKKDVKWFFYIILIKLALYFVLKFWGTFSLSAILSINFNDSNSSLYEIVIAHDFLFLMIVFIYFDDLRAVLISFALCVLSFKRLPFVLSFCILTLYLLGKSGKAMKIGLFNKKSAKWIQGTFSNGTLFFIFSVMIALPFIMQWVYSSDGVQWFNSTFAMDLNKETSGRVNIVNYALNNFTPNGLGSITHFYETNSNELFRRIANMHCDVIRLEKEVTIIGYTIYSYVLIKVFSKSRLTMIMLLYLVAEMTLSHMADQLNIWIIVYLFTAYLSKKNAGRVIVKS